MNKMISKIVKNIGIIIVDILIIIILVKLVINWSSISQNLFPSNYKTEMVNFSNDTVTLSQFTSLSSELKRAYCDTFPHIEAFKEQKIYSYEGPQTCFKCHKKIKIETEDSDSLESINLLDNILNSVHYKLSSKPPKKLYTAYGNKIKSIRIGMVNLYSDLWNSYAFASWAGIVITENYDTLSVGCGRCHIGGQYSAPIHYLTPGYSASEAEINSIDCLICHASDYNMNLKKVVKDPNGRYRWDQDRSLLAAMSVTKPKPTNCLRCHFQNYTTAVSKYKADYLLPKSLESLPIVTDISEYSDFNDIHLENGLNCLSCHTNEGHLIAKGDHYSSVLANDLPKVKIECSNQGCHSSKPHPNDSEYGAKLNLHLDRIACQSCHLSIESDGLKVTNENTELFHQYIWWNSASIFNGYPIGKNPDYYAYISYSPSHLADEFTMYNYNDWYTDLIERMEQFDTLYHSLIYPVVLFNNKSPVNTTYKSEFGYLKLPYFYQPDRIKNKRYISSIPDYNKSIFESGFYTTVLSIYLLNHINSYQNIRNVKGNITEKSQIELKFSPFHRATGLFHGIKPVESVKCERCHSKNSILDYSSLGYSESDIEKLQNMHTIH